MRSIVRLGAAALRRLRRPRVRLAGPVPPRSRLSVEPLTDRLVPSADFTSLSDLNLAHALADTDTAVRFVEIPASGPWQDHVNSQASPISPRQMFGVLGGVSGLAQLGAPTLTVSTVEYGGETIPILVLQFGSSLTIDLAYSTNGVGTDLQSDVVGGLVSVYRTRPANGVIDR
ncbi:hypothetical protein [Frigoriglobus tundricola]|uniref:hypothetical protein n=1 Tax=Frigoriglobus tundricola TaxID=2774151 RepID=UPI00148EA895|nr:hypothetical protein [Frigoriglobus tundricola]